MKRFLTLCASSLLFLVSGCLGITGHVGFTEMELGGDLALTATGGGIPLGSIEQDLESAMGLGEPSGSPYARLAVDFGWSTLTASGFLFSDSGSGTLNANFGTIPVGTGVTSDMDFANFKAAFVFDIPFPLITLSPGIGIDVFDMNFRVQDTGGFFLEDVDVLAPVPMLMLRGKVELGDMALVAETGYLSFDANDLDAAFWDAEGWLEFQPLPMVFLFAGYRFISIDGDGTVDGQDLAVDLEIRGWQVGGGVRF